LEGYVSGAILEAVRDKILASSRHLYGAVKPFQLIRQTFLSLMWRSPPQSLVVKLQHNILLNCTSELISRLVCGKFTGDFLPIVISLKIQLSP
jgi:hypothetical protein